MAFSLNINKWVIAVFVLVGVSILKRKKIYSEFNSFSLSLRSEAEMLGVKDDLKAVTRRALELSPYDFGVTSGIRTEAEQHEMFKKGASNMDGTNRISKHQTGDAIDFMAYDKNGKPTWNMKYYKAVSNAFKMASHELDIPIIWGGDWKTLQDGPHVELA